MSAEDYSHLACPNPDCSAYGQRGAGNLRLHGWSGQGTAHPLPALRHLRHRLLRTCQHAPVRPAPPARTPSSPSPSTSPRGSAAAPPPGCAGVSLNTVLRFTARFGKHAELFHDTHGPRRPAQTDPARRGLVLRGEKRQELRPARPRRRRARQLLGPRHHRPGNQADRQPGGGPAQRRHGGRSLHRLLRADRRLPARTHLHGRVCGVRDGDPGHLRGAASASWG